MAAKKVKSFPDKNLDKAVKALAKASNKLSAHAENTGDDLSRVAGQVAAQLSNSLTFRYYYNSKAYPLTEHAKAYDKELSK
jgi:hypothetical protein